ASAKPPLDCFADGEGLRHREANGRVDVDAGRRRILDRLDTCPRRRSLHLHVRCKIGETKRLLCDARSVTKELRVRLDREPPLPTAFTLEHRLQELGCL